MAIARPTHRRLFAVFDHAYGRLSRRAGVVLADIGVKPAQATALVYLGYHNGCQLSELAEGVGAGNAAVTGLVDRMEKTGLVERRKLQSDGRGKTVHLTPAGLAKREQVMERLRTLDEKLSKNFTDAEMETVYKFLNIASELDI
ncbi:MAG: MarR family transcriptional regulator [Robiginitomaculum sp.]|nr:MarR family transcriptional regulator [Robiginitomaculum sp.]